MPAPVPNSSGPIIVGARIRGPRQAGARRHQNELQDHQSSHHLCRIGHRCLGRMGNALSPWDHVPMVETGHLATLWKEAVFLNPLSGPAQSDWRIDDDLACEGNRPGKRLGLM